MQWCKTTIPATLDEELWPGLDSCRLDRYLEVDQHLLSRQLHPLPCQLQLDHCKEDGVGDLLLVGQEAVDHRQPFFSHLCLKTIANM